MTGMLLALATLALLAVPASAGSCSHTFSSHGATFDLSPFVRASDNPYTVEDKKDAAEADFDYVFNICEDLATLPKPESKGIGCSGAGAAYQLINDTTADTDKNCHLLGTAGSATWQLLDETDATTGVNLTYTDGEDCIHGGKRSISFLFQCGVEQTVIPLTKVEEYEHCDYTITFNSIHACPRDCVSGDNKMCGNHGVCALDHHNQDTHCFCNSGHKGDQCTSKKSSGSSATASGVMAAISIVLLILLLGVGGYLYYTIRELKTEGSEYGGLEDMVNDVTGHDSKGHD